MLTGPDRYLEMLLLIVRLGAIFIEFIFPHVCFSLKMSRRIYAAAPVKQRTSDNCAMKRPAMRLRLDARSATLRSDYKSLRMFAYMEAASGFAVKRS